MTPNEHSDLLRRLERLEIRNRRLTLALGICLVAPVLALAGWTQLPTQDPIPDVLRAYRIEVFDEKGVPIVTIGQDRLADGGTITLRDRTGEKRTWWKATPTGAAMALNSEPSDQVGNSIGLSASESGSQIDVIGKNGAQFSAGINDGKPRLDLWNEKGDTLFGAPWTPPRRKPSP